MSVKIQPKAGFDWRRVVWSPEGSPQPALCSYCFAAVPDDIVPLMMFNGSGELAQFCDGCAAKWWGLRE